MINNSDVLFIEDVARDLNAGGDLYNWRLTQAPYIFPDIFLARIISIFAEEPGTVGIYYHIIFGLLIALMLYLFTKSITKNPFLLPSFALGIYFISYYGLSSGDVISMYFGLIGHHSGIIIPIILASFSLVYFFNEKKSLGIILIFISTFIGTLSDSLVAAAMLPPLLTFALILYYNKNCELSNAIQLFTICFSAVVIAKIFGYMNPFPQDREFMSFVLNNFPNWTLQSIHKFVNDLTSYATKSIISLLILILYITSLIISFIFLFRRGKVWNKVDFLPIFLALFIITSPVSVIAVQLFIGLYGSIDSSRQWAPLIYLSIVYGYLIYVNQFKNSFIYSKIIIIIVFLTPLVIVTPIMHKNKGIISDPNNFKKIVKCMADENLPEGALYIADYWIARPIRFYSNGLFDVSPYGGGLQPFTNASNVSKARMAQPRFVITGHAVDYNLILNKYGAPRQEYCKIDVVGVQLRILDYSENDFAIQDLRSKAIKSY
jgi:hypothetical protein